MTGPLYTLKPDPEHTKRLKRFAYWHNVRQYIFCWLRPWRWHRAPPWRYNHRRRKAMNWWKDNLDNA